MQFISFKWYSSSTFLDNFILEFPIIVKKLQEDLYLAAPPTGCETFKQGNKFYKAANKKLAGFSFRKVSPNDKQLQDFFDRGADKAFEYDMWSS